MASDDHRPVESTGAASPDEHIDEGRIHEWLDGQCDAETAAQLEALVQSSPSFAARVAEARGLTAAASRILSALDDVPANVLPMRPSIAPGGARAVSRGPSRTVTRWSAIAALLAVAATGVWVTQRNPSPLAPNTGVAMITRETATAAPETRRIDAAGAAAATAPLPAAAAAAANAPMTIAENAPMAAAQTAPPPEADSVPRAAAPAPMAAGAHSAKAMSTERAVADAPTGTVATAPGVPRPENAAGPTAAARRAVAPASANALGASRLAAAPSVTADAAEDARPEASNAAFVPDDSLAYAVHRVACTPACRSLRTDVARDGRVRQSDGRVVRVERVALQRLATLADSLQLAALPATLRLEGRLCRTVGSLRESLRVQFRVNDALRQVMGVPWCSDGTHPLDVFAAAIESLGRP